MPESSRLEFLEKFSANNFALSDAEDYTFGPWYSRFTFVKITTRFIHKQPTILIEPQRCLVVCDLQGNLSLSCCLIFIKKMWTLKLQEKWKFCPKRVTIRETKLDFIILMKQTVDAIITLPVRAIFKAVYFYFMFHKRKDFLTQWTMI